MYYTFIFIIFPIKVYYTLNVPRGNLKMFRELKEILMANVMSGIDEVHCSACDDFVIFTISSRKHEKLRSFAVFETIYVEYWVDLECPHCAKVLCTFRGKEFPRMRIAKKD